MEPVVLRPRLRVAARGSEAELLARVRNGDEGAFEALYDAYHRRLLAFCQHMLGSREEAEDALQHTFLAAYRSLRAGYEVVDLKPWLYTIARNRCLSVLRARREEVELDDGASRHRGARGGGRSARRPAACSCATSQRLPPDQRAALVLFEVGDHSQEEIAAVLGVRREKVKALVFQAREALMGWRAARETPCAHVREQIANLRGARWAAPRSAATSSCAPGARTTRPRCAASAPRWPSRCRSPLPPRGSGPRCSAGRREAPASERRSAPAARRAPRAGWRAWAQRRRGEGPPGGRARGGCRRGAPCDRRPAARSVTSSAQRRGHVRRRRCSAPRG